MFEMMSEGKKELSSLEKILRRLHLISVVIMILVELGFLIAIIFCCITQTKSNRKNTFDSHCLKHFHLFSDSLGQILAVFLILISLFVLMTLIYFLRKDQSKYCHPNPFIFIF